MDAEARHKYLLSYELGAPPLKPWVRTDPPQRKGKETNVYLEIKLLGGHLAVEQVWAVRP